MSNVLYIIPRELLMIVVSFLPLSTKFAILHVSKFFEQFILKIHVEFEMPRLFRTMDEILTDAVEYPNVFKWLIPDTKCLSRYYAEHYCKTAVTKKSFEIVRHTFNDALSGVFPSHICIEAARNCRDINSVSFDILKWLYDQYIVFIFIINNINMTYELIPKQYTDIFTHQSIYEMAARYGSIEVLKWLHKKNFTLNDRIFYLVANSDRDNVLEILKWLHENGCPWNETACYGAAERGHFDALKWLHENGCPLGEGICSAATESGNLEMLKWLRSNGCRWDNDTFPNAISSGNLEMIQWLHENNCPWNGSTCTNAVTMKRLDILRWLIEKGCPPEQDSCVWAARYGRLDMLKLIHQTGFPMCEIEFSGAVQNNHYEVVKWLYENGCPRSTTVYQTAAKNNHLDIMRFLRSHGC